MTITELEAAGYKRYNAGASTRLKMADSYFAKMLEDERGRMFQIVFYYYDWRNHVGDFPCPESFQPEVQLRDDDFCVDINLHSRPDQTVADVEAYFMAQWVHHGRPYYRLWEKD